MTRFQTTLALSASLMLVAPASSQTTLPALAGWKTQTRTNGARTFTPPDLKTGEVYSVTTYALAPLDGKTPEAFLRDFAGTVGTQAGQLSAPLTVEVNGVVVSGSGVYVGPNEAKLGVFFLGVSRDEGTRIAVSRTLFSRSELLSRYQTENGALNKTLSAQNEQFPTGPMRKQRLHLQQRGHSSPRVWAARRCS